MVFLQKIKNVFRKRHVTPLHDYFIALKALCYTTLALVPVCLLGGWILWEWGYLFPLYHFSTLGGFAVGISLAVFSLAYQWREKRILGVLLWFYVGMVTLIETLAIYFSGGIVSPAYWLYFLTISQLIIFLSPIIGITVAVFDLWIFLSMIYLQLTGFLSKEYSLLAGFNPFENFLTFISPTLGSLSLYALGVIFLSIIIFRLREEHRNLENTNILLAKQSEEMKRLLELSEERRLAIEVEHQELVKTKESIFKLMHNVEEVNKRLRMQGKELEKRKNELEALNKRLLTKQEDLIKSTEELERANMELMKLDRLKSEFISTVSHEIRTPLTSIREGVSLMNEKALGPLNPQQEKFMSIVQNNVLRLSTLIHDILDLSKLESGQTEFRRQPLNIVSFTNDVVDSLRTLVLKRQIRIETSFSKDLPMVYADENRVAQVLMNLIGNAVKFTPDGGMIVVGAYHFIHDDIVHVSVMDTGRGIPREEIPQVFNKFHQVGRETGPGAKGTGLGLPICQEIIQLHGGKIWAESEVGRGSKFTFTLPVFTTVRYVEDLFQEMVTKAEIQGSRVAFVLYKILGFPFLKLEADPKYILELFDHFVDLVSSRIRADSRIVSDSEDGFVLVLQIAEEDSLGREIREVENALNNASFFLGNQETPLKFHIAKAVYPQDGSSKEKLLQLLGLREEMLVQFKP